MRVPDNIFGRLVTYEGCLEPYFGLLVPYEGVPDAVFTLVLADLEGKLTFQDKWST